MRMYWLAVCAASVMCACEVGIGDVPDHRPDAAKALTVVDGRALDIDATVDAKPERTLSQTTNNAIVQNNGLACLNYGYTDEASPGLFLRKAMTVANLFGSASLHRARYARLAPEEAAD